MPRCTDGHWCVDDMCHWGGRTLCGIEREELDQDGEWHDPYDDYEPEDWETTLAGEDSDR